MTKKDECIQEREACTWENYYYIFFPVISSLLVFVSLFTKKKKEKRSLWTNIPPLIFQSYRLLNRQWCNVLFTPVFPFSALYIFFTSCSLIKKRCIDKHRINCYLSDRFKQPTTEMQHNQTFVPWFKGKHEIRSSHFAKKGKGTLFLNLLHSYNKSILIY